MYNIDRDSLKGDEDSADALTVSPMSGVIPPQEVFRLGVTLSHARTLNTIPTFVINVKQKARPLVFNINGLGYIISHSVHYESSYVGLLTDEICNLKFGSLFVNETLRRTIEIVNSGKYKLDYSWKMSNKVRLLSIIPKESTVKSGDISIVELKYLLYPGTILSTLKST